jgi:zinc protease
MVLLLGALPFAYSQATDWQQIPIPTLPPFHPAEPKRVELPNGLVIFLQEDHELPLIDGSIRIRGGSRDESAQKVGLVQLYGDVWRTGGTKSQTGDQMDDYLESRAAKVETGGGVDATSLGWSCLKDDFDDVFKIVLDLLHDPESRAATTILARLPRASPPSLPTAPTILTLARWSTPRSRRSSAMTCSPGIRNTSTPIT